MLKSLLFTRIWYQTVETLIEAIAQALDTITPYDAIGFFTHAGFLNLD